VRLVDELGRAVQAVEGDEEPAQQGEDRASGRLGRVRGEDRLVVAAREDLQQVVEADTLVPDGAQRLVERAAPQLAAPAGDPPALAVLEILLGEVDELEVDAEGADDGRQDVGRELGDGVLEPALACRVRPLAQAQVAPLQARDDALDPGVGLGAQDLGEEAVEEPDRVPELAGRAAGSAR